MDLTLLKHSLLFQGMEEPDIASMLQCLSAAPRSFQKNEYIFHTGDRIRQMGLILSGRVSIEKEDIWGNRRILAAPEAGSLFGESYACQKEEPLTVSVRADCSCTILFLDVNKVLSTCSNACPFHTRLIRNLLYILAGKNLFLTRKIDHITQKTIREKILSYLDYQSGLQGARSFDIPFSRQQMADYLSADRSALSAELSRMQADGLIRYQKNHFEILSGREDD